jgi:geranylgeranyl diphosphate synthase, type II
VLLAMALDAADDAQRAEIEELLRDEQVNSLKLGRLRRIFEQCGVFTKAEALVAKSRARAEALADEVEPDELRRLLYFLVDTVLADDEPEVRPDPAVLVQLPIAAPA